MTYPPAGLYCTIIIISVSITQQLAITNVMSPMPGVVGFESHWERYHFISCEAEKQELLCNDMSGICVVGNLFLCPIVT